MPLYDFKCPDHGTFEARTAMSERAILCKVPGCQNVAIRLLSVRGQTVAIPRRFLNGVTKADVLGD